MNASQLLEMANKVFVNCDQEAIKAEKKMQKKGKPTGHCLDEANGRCPTRPRSERGAGDEEDHLTQGQNWDGTNMPTVTRKATGKMSALNCQMIPNRVPSRGEEARWSGANISWPNSHVGSPKTVLQGWPL